MRHGHFHWLACLCLSVSFVLGAELEYNPLDEFERWEYGRYENRQTAEKIITPEYLRNLPEMSEELIDAVRIFFVTENTITASHPETLTPLGRIIREEIMRRGDSITPILIGLMKFEGENKHCQFHASVLSALGGLRTIDVQPFLDYVRDYIISHPNEKMTLENASGYSSINQFLSAIGEEKDVDLLRGREGSAGWLQYMIPRLKEEKVSGVSRLEQWRNESTQIREAYGLPPIVPSTYKKPVENLNSHPSDWETNPLEKSYWKFFLAVLVVVLIGVILRIAVARKQP